jgi:plasmid stabilization system protein ParE
MRVRYTPRAREDFAEILFHLDQGSPQGARSVKQALRRTVDLIGVFPRSGRLAGEQDSRVLPVGRYPYLVYWSIEADQVLILHIRHAARRRYEGSLEEH